jgi:hypothetical protein
MATAAARPRSRAGYGMFSIGLSFIGAATVLNIAYDRLSWVGVEVMPQFLAHMYDTSGKPIVTLVFVAVGLSFILMGFALPRGRVEQRSSNRQQVRIAAPLYSADSDAEADEQGVTSNGTVVLRTRKYLADTGLSGATGWASPRRTN